MSPVFPIFDRGDPPDERPEGGGQGSQEDCQGEPGKKDQQGKEQSEDISRSKDDPTENQAHLLSASCILRPHTCKTTEDIKHDDVTDDEDDHGRHRSSQYAEFQGSNQVPLQSSAPVEPPLCYTCVTLVHPTSARDCVTLIAEKIENLKMQNKMKIALSQKAKAQAQIQAKAQKEEKTTTMAATKNPDYKEQVDCLDPVYLAALAKSFTESSEDEEKELEVNQENLARQTRQFENQMADIEKRRKQLDEKYGYGEIPDQYYWCNFKATEKHEEHEKKKEKDKYQ